MRRFLFDNRYPTLALLMLIMGTSLIQADEFAVSGRNDYKILRSELQAVQFLARATFGYTYGQDLDPQSDLDVKYLAKRIRQRGHRRALSEWIDAQAGLPATKHEGLGSSPPDGTVLKMLADDGYTDPYADRPASGAYNRTDYRDFAWWHAALNAPDQLRQRMAFALMQIVVINDDASIFDSNNQDNSGAPRYTGVVNYYDMLIENAFGNYRTVLGDVAFHPVMGIFLTHKDNRKPSADGLLLPDENFAREILQLFTMGQFRTDNGGVMVMDRAGKPLRNYTNEDIKALARVFTGLRYQQNSTNLHDPMEIVFSSHHDFDEKVFPNLRFTLEGSTTQNASVATDEINQAIDRIYQHPNVGPYIARILIQRFVKANPSTTYINDVATVFNDDGQGQRGNLLAVVKAILLHKEALGSQRYLPIRSGRNISGLRVRTRGTEHCKLVEPIVRYAQFIKMFNGQAINPSQGLRVRPSILDLSQLSYKAPSVFNYYQPDYRPPGDLSNYTPSRSIPNGAMHSPEAQIYTPVFANRFQNMIYEHLINRYSSTGNYNRLNFFNNGALAVEEGLAASGLAAVGGPDFSELLERLDLMLCHGSLSKDSKTKINNVLVNSGNTNSSELARLAIFGVCGTPESAIDE